MTEANAKTPEKALAWKSVRWRNAAGWLVVAIIAWRYLIYDLISVSLVAQGMDALEPLGDIALADAAAIVGLPLGGSVADRMTEGPKLV